MSESLADLLPTTELEAVNIMLASIGEAPIDTLVDIEAPDAGVALLRLRQVSRGVQSKGWEWNTEENTVLTPDVDGLIQLPANTLKVQRGDDTRWGLDVADRGGRLYDRKNKTYTFTESVKLTIVLNLPFEEMPEAARQYIALLAAQKFQQGVIGSATLDAFAKEAMNEARDTLYANEADEGDYNLLTDNWDTFRIFHGRVGGW